MRRYFRMQQDTNLPDVIQLKDFDICGARHQFHKSDAKRINRTTVLYLAEDTGEAIPDLVQSPVTMVTQEMKQVLDLYEDGLIFKNVTLIHKEKKQQILYYQVLMDEIKAVSEQTTHYPNGTVKQLILDQGQIGYHKVFLLSDSQMKDPIVSLEVVESLLRRGLMGVLFKEIEVREWQN